MTKYTANFGGEVFEAELPSTLDGADPALIFDVLTDVAVLRAERKAMNMPEPNAEDLATIAYLHLNGALQW